MRSSRNSSSGRRSNGSRQDRARPPRSRPQPSFRRRSRNRPLACQPRTAFNRAGTHQRSEGLNMRAEAQAHIDQINAATALLRRFIDWDRALKRLEELNAKVEDSTLWDDPKAAQEVMRERQRLEHAIGAVGAIERELADTSELIEL